MRDVTGADGIRRAHHREATREVESVFGTVQVTRDRVGARGSDALVPADAALNLPEDRFTFGVRERVAEEAARGSFEAAASATSSTTGAGVAKRQAEELTLLASVDFDAVYEESMATVAAVYYQEPVPRTSDDILRNLDGEPAKARPKPQRKRVFASVKKTAQQVVSEVFDEAPRRDPTHQHRWVALVDGNKIQIQEIRAAAKAAGVEVPLVLDIIHVTEYLWSAAWDFHAEGDPAAEKWVRKYLRQILAGRAGTVAAAIRRSATSRKLEKRTNTDKAAGYFLGKKDLMRYDEYLQEGLPIATGVIEGACRHLVKDRMDITGARWGLDGAEAVLRLRSLRVSGDLDRYWAFHRARKFERNHRSRYDDQEDEWLARVAA
jgi:hypothetical protein